MNKAFTIVTQFVLTLTLDALQFKSKNFSLEQRDLNASIAKHYSDQASENNSSDDGEGKCEIHTDEHDTKKKKKKVVSTVATNYKFIIIYLVEHRIQTILALQINIYFISHTVSRGRY